MYKWLKNCTIRKEREREREEEEEEKKEMYNCTNKKKQYQIFNEIFILKYT
jgi:hypothetical protein